MLSAEKALIEAAKKPDFLCITGSRLYGTFRADSDTDYRGFFMPPYEYLTTREKDEVELAKPHSTSIDIPDGDHKVFSLETFVKGLCKCDPQMLELLFAPPTHHVFVSPLAQELLDSRDKFVAKKFYWRIVGFSNSEWRKARGVKVIIPDRTKTEDDIIMDIRNVFGPEKSDMDQIITLLYSKRKYKEVSSLQGISTKRRDEHCQYGYTASSACHSLRLLYQCRELLETGTMTFPRPERVFLFDVKQGKVELAELEAEYAEAKAKCDEAFASSKLKEAPDNEWAMEWYETQVAKALLLDERIRFRVISPDDYE